MTDLLGSRPCLGEFTAESAEKFAEMGRLADGYAAEASALTLSATAVERVLRLQEAKCEAGSVSKALIRCAPPRLLCDKLQ